MYVCMKIIMSTSLELVSSRNKNIPPPIIMQRCACRKEAINLAGRMVINRKDAINFMWEFPCTPGVKTLGYYHIK